MVFADSQRLEQVVQLAPPDDAPENPRYVRTVVLWLRVRDRTVVLQRQLDRLHAEIGACLTIGSPQALVAASQLADRLAIDALDVAQLLVFADALYQQLMALVS